MSTFFGEYSSPAICFSCSFLSFSVFLLLLCWFICLLIIEWIEFFLDQLFAGSLCRRGAKAMFQGDRSWVDESSCSFFQVRGTTYSAVPPFTLSFASCKHGLSVGLLIYPLLVCFVEPQESTNCHLHTLHSCSYKQGILDLHLRVYASPQRNGLFGPLMRSAALGILSPLLSILPACLHCVCHYFHLQVTPQ